MLGIDGSWVSAKEQFKCDAAIDLQPVQHSLWKQLRGPQRKQAEMGTADHLRHSKRCTETKYKWNWTFKMFVSLFEKLDEMVCILL